MNSLMPIRRPPDSDFGAERVAAILRIIGYQADRVPVCHQRRTCDLVACRGPEQLLVEVKGYEPPHDARAALRRGDAVELGGALGRSRREAKKLSDAAEQTASVAADGGRCLQLLWNRFQDLGEIRRSLQTLCTLYGIRFFDVPRSTPGGYSFFEVTPVFFADRPWFRGHTSVAGVMAESSAKLSLWANPFSADRQHLRSTSIYRLLRAAGAVCEPEVLSAAGAITCSDADATTEAEVINSVARRYNLEVRPSTAAARSVAWPDNEMGSCPFIPGADASASLHLLTRLATGGSPSALRLAYTR